MAAPQQIILPEVHLDSPIVQNKLLYFVRLGGLPLPDLFFEDDFFPDVDWDRVRREENRLSSRLETIRSRILAKTQTGSGLNPINKTAPLILLWPSCLTRLHQFTFPEALSRFHDANKIMQAACNYLSAGLTTVLTSVSEKLTNKTNLFTHNESQCLHVRSHDRPQDLKQICEQMTNAQWKSQFDLWFLVRHQMRTLINKNNNQSTDKLVIEMDRRVQSIIITPELVALWDREDNFLTYLTFEMVLMVCDLYEGRLNILGVAKMSCYLSPLTSRLNKLFEIVDELCTLLGNQVYAIVASLESLVYARLQLLDPVEEVCGDFYSFICKELIDGLTANDVISIPEAELIADKLLDCYNNLTPDLIAELLCVMRMWGHPMLTSEKAAAKVRESMCAPKVIDFETTLKTLAFFNEIIINGYRRKHNGIWPKCKLPPYASLSLQELKHDNSEISHQYTLTHWKEIAFIEFEKSFDADPGSDLSIFMKDKAISAPKKDWLSVFRKSLIKPLCERLHQPMPSSYNRRLLLNFLDDDQFDPVKELEYVTSGAYLDDEDFCASYSLKEKEIKETGRIFAKLTKKMRSCQVICESLLANHAGKLFKENGVVVDHLNLTKSLLTMSQIGLISTKSRRAARENITVVSHLKSRNNNPTQSIQKQADQPTIDETTEIAAFFLTTDLKKYCLNWRYQSIILFATSLNKLYGYPHLFEWIHLRLMRSTLYVGDPFNPPRFLNTLDLDEVQNDGIFIVSPRGGIEGLCQKMWTMISIAVITLSATESSTRVMSMVQGDNQAIAMTTKVPRSLNHRQKKEIAYNNSKLFVERLRYNNRGLGHHLKEQETIMSSDFFVYSKRIVFRGRILNQALKNVSKLNLIADVLSECTQTSCSNLTTTIMRLTENGVEKDICYNLSFFFSIKQLVYDLLFPITTIFEDEVTALYLNHPILISRLCLLPSQLGGLNFYSISRLFNRNIGDPLTSAIADLKRFLAADLLPKWTIANLLGRNPGKGTWSTLAADPYSLNIDYLYPPTTYLKKHTQRVLMEGSVNPMLQGIFTDNAIEEENAIAKFLLDRPIVMPRVAHIVLEQTSCGRRKQIQGFLDTTRTIIRHALAKQPPSYKKLEKIIDYNRLYLAYNLELISKPNDKKAERKAREDLVNVCSIDLAKLLRRMSWSQLLSGRPIDGLETPDPTELIQGYIINGNDNCLACLQGDRKFTWFYIPGNITLDAPPEDNPPIRVPYIGSRTDERRVASLGYVKGATQALKSALRLAGVYIWAFGDTDDNWNDALNLASTRVNITLEQLRTLTPMPTSTNLTHRLDDGLTQMKFTPASSYAISSYVHISNDNQNLEIMDKQLDCNLIYQQIMLLGLGIIETWLQLPQYQNIDDFSVHLHTEGSCCIRAVDMCVINETSDEVPPMSVPYGNKFVYDDSPLDHDQQVKIENLSFQANITGLDIIPTEEKIPLLAHFVGLQFAHSLTGLDEATSLVNDAVIETDYANNWISECLNTYMDKVFYYTAWNMLLDLSYQMYYLRVTGITAILDYMTLILDRIPGLALTGIASTISHPKILRRLINLGIVIPSNSPYLATLDYHKMSTLSIMWGVQSVLSDISSGLDIELIIPSEDSTELSDRVLNLVARKLSLISLVIGHGSALSYVRGLTPDVKCKTLTEKLIVIIETTITDPEQRGKLSTLVTEPKISAFPSNLYYLMRKLLNWIRDSDKAQQLIAMFYDSFGYMEFQTSDISPINHSIDTCTSNSLTIHDKVSNILDYDTVAEKYAYPKCDPSLQYHMKPVADPPVHHILRPIGLSSTSWYKGLSILNVLSCSKVPTGNHLYLAEGSGALMTLIESYIPAQKIYYNSLFSSGQCPPQRNFQPMPTQFTESMVYMNIQNGYGNSDLIDQEFIALWSGVERQTDLSKKDCIEFILQQIPSQSLSLISSDIEEGIGSNLTQLSKATINSVLLSYVLLKDGGLLIMKINLTPFCKFSQLITLLSSKFKNIKAVRSSYSDPSTDELYLVATASGDSSVGDFNAARYNSDILDSESFTLVSPQLLLDLHHGITENQKTVYDIIEMQISTGQCFENIEDHETLIKLGSSTQRNRLMTSPAAESRSELLERISDIITLYLKETINIIESSQLDRNRLLYNSYNVSSYGKIRTSAKLSAKLVLDIFIRNWINLGVPLRKRIAGMIEKGYFCVGETISCKDYLSFCKARKYLLKTIGIDQLAVELEQNLSCEFQRSEQKKLWKNIGCIAFIESIEPGDFNSPEQIFQDDEIEERDIGGELL
ncbi:RNA polymerase [Tuhoko virus 2]|uniref:RNA-directed RNA polymerase L n=1 Tax=Tuhoko virus 2 TaxID=798073 RepID=D8WJ35_9MONO|nr:RNA polymerase [Tuhoko virus 2]ADI80722.1 RNA polymerase [Tuhoko virus 2]